VTLVGLKYFQELHYIISIDEHLHEGSIRNKWTPRIFCTMAVQLVYEKDEGDMRGSITVRVQNTTVVGDNLVAHVTWRSEYFMRTRKGSSCSFFTNKTWIELEPEIRIETPLSSRAVG